MASKLVGRTVCPECNNQKAHVKIMAEPDGTPVKGKRHYRHCPDGDCGAQYNPRNDRQEQMLLAKTRPEGTAPASATATHTPPASEVEQPPAIVPVAEVVAPKTKLVFGVRVPA